MRVAVTLCLVFLLAAGALAQVELGDDPISQAAIQIAEKLAAAAEPKSGEVVDEDTTDMQHPTLYVMLGSKDGVGEGTMLDIIEKGAPIKVGEEIIGFRENPAGTAKIVRVQSEKLSVARVETIVPGESPGKDCIAYVKTVPETLAVCAFQNSDKAVSQLGLDFADKVGAALSGTGKFTVIERPQLEELLVGLKAATADLLNPEKSAALAPKVPAKALVTGTIAKQNDRYAIAVRVLEIGAGIPLGATTATIARSDEADSKYADAKSRTGGGGGTVTPPPPDEPDLFAKSVKWIANDGSLCPVRDVSVGGVYWPVAEELDPGDKADLIAVLQRDWRSITLELGVSDAEATRWSSNTGGQKVELLLDGKPVEQVELRFKAPPTKVTLDATGASALAMRSGGGPRVVVRQGSVAEIDTDAGGPF